MGSIETEPSTGQQQDFMRNLLAFTREHKSSFWSGTLAQFLEQIITRDAHGVARSAHQYIWDMIRWTRPQGSEAP
nr:serine protein kinase [Oxalobacteraceae bacterium]